MTVAGEPRRDACRRRGRSKLASVPAIARSRASRAASARMQRLDARRGVQAGRAGRRRARRGRPPSSGNRSTSSIDPAVDADDAPHALRMPPRRARAPRCRPTTGRRPRAVEAQGADHRAQVARRRCHVVAVVGLVGAAVARAGRRRPPGGRARAARRPRRPTVRAFEARPWTSTNGMAAVSPSRRSTWSATSEATGTRSAASGRRGALGAPLTAAPSRRAGRSRRARAGPRASRRSPRSPTSWETPTTGARASRP